MRTFKLHNTKYEDYIFLTGETIEEIVDKAATEMLKRGWNKEDCYSEEVHS